MVCYLQFEQFGSAHKLEKPQEVSGLSDSVWTVGGLPQGRLWLKLEKEELNYFVHMDHV